MPRGLLVMARGRTASRCCRREALGDSGRAVGEAGSKQRCGRSRLGAPDRRRCSDTRSRRTDRREVAHVPTEAAHRDLVLVQTKTADHRGIGFPRQTALDRRLIPTVAGVVDPVVAAGTTSKLVQQLSTPVPPGPQSETPAPPARQLAGIVVCPSSPGGGTARSVVESVVLVSSPASSTNGGRSKSAPSSDPQPATDEKARTKARGNGRRVSVTGPRAGRMSQPLQRCKAGQPSSSTAQSQAISAHRCRCIPKAEAWCSSLGFRR
jgi:hypothetical protein